MLQIWLIWPITLVQHLLKKLIIKNWEFIFKPSFSKIFGMAESWDMMVWNSLRQTTNRLKNVSPFQQMCCTLAWTASSKTNTAYFSSNLFVGYEQFFCFISDFTYPFQTKQLPSKSLLQKQAYLLTGLFVHIFVIQVLRKFYLLMASMKETPLLFVGEFW